MTGFPRVTKYYCNILHQPEAQSSVDKAFQLVRNYEFEYMQNKTFVFQEHRDKIEERHKAAIAV